MKDKNNKLQIIGKYIERNFGGIEYEIDIDFDLSDDIKNDIQLIRDFVKDYNGPNRNKLNSVYLFKKLFRIKKRGPNSRLIMKEENIMNYN